MKFRKSRKFIGLCLLALSSFSCQKQASESGGKASTPTEAYRMLFAAVKARDIEKIRQMMSKNTLALAEAQSQTQKQTIEKTLENGFLATTFSDTMPEIRDERVKDQFGAVEVYNQKEGKWDDTFFINEDGGWKLAVGDILRNTYKFPGKSRSQVEKENSNSFANNTIPSTPDQKANKNGGGTTIEVTPQPSPKNAEKPGAKK